MKIPHYLILFRLLQAPTVLLLAYFFGNESRIIILVLLFLGLLSDIFDGIIARKQNISSIKLRRMDSQVDLIFWLAIGFSCYMIQPEIFEKHKIGIITLFVMELLCYAISFLKFGKETCTHAFLSKIWGLLLFSSFVAVLGFNHSGLLLSITIVWGIISQVDVILIILILPKWQNDIPSLYHSYLIRKGIPFKKSKLLND